MAKEKFNLKKSFFSFFISHPWLKLIALVLAVLTWFYVRGEIGKYY